jgi:hypothetical protein
MFHIQALQTAFAAYDVGQRNPVQLMFEPGRHHFHILLVSVGCNMENIGISAIKSEKIPSGKLT